VALELPSGITWAAKVPDQVSVDLGTVSKTDYDELLDEHKFLCCIGAVTYADAAGGIRTTAFYREMEVWRARGKTRDDRGRAIGRLRRIKEPEPDYEYED